MIKLFGPNWELEDVELVLFDKDGTLIDSHLYWGSIIQKRARAIIEHYNMPKESFYGLCMIMGYSLDSGRLSPQGPVALVSREEVIDIVDDYLGRIGVAGSKEAIEDIFSFVHKEAIADIKDISKLLPGAEETLKKMNETGLKLALVTSDSVINTREILKILNIDEYFTLVAGREFCSEPKSSGAPAKKACGQLKIETKKAICIGDAPMDIAMADGAHLKACISVALGQTPASDLRQQNEYVINNYSELSVQKYES